MHEAAARERHEIRLAVAPAQSGGPFLRAAHLVDLLTGEDHAAVDEPGDDRRELVRRERDHRLVEQRHTLGHATARGQDVPLRVRREGEQVGLPEALAGRRGLTGCCGCGLPVADRQMLEDGR